MLSRSVLKRLAPLAVLASVACHGKKEAPPIPSSATAAPPSTPPSASAAPPPPAAALGQRTAECWAAFDRADFEELGRCYAEDVTSHWLDSGLPDEKGRTAVVENRKKGIKTAFPDGKLVPQLVFVNGFDVAGTAVMSGTHQGPLVEAGGVLPATKKAFGELVFFATTFDSERRMREEWLLTDHGSLLFQLGQSTSKARPRNTTGLVNAPVVMASTGSAAELANVAVVEAGWRALAAGNLSAFAALLADDVVLSEQWTPADARGKQAALVATDATTKTLKKLELSCPKRWGAAAYVVSLCQVSATAAGETAGAPHPISLALAEVVRLDAGLEREIIRFLDGKKLASELGTPLAPPAGSAKRGAP